MRFDRIHIPAFGPFTHLDLRFPARNDDLHIIHGNNEAGKSSLLRAFRDLLFGMHGQSPDNFLHEYKNLRIRGEIINRAGERLAFQRRKGNKNTLLDSDGNPLPDHALVSFLGTVDQAYFSTMFGMGVRELREGAEQLLRGEGHIGNALFSASMGGTPVQTVLAALKSESDLLFKGRSTSNVSIRPSANEYRHLMRKCREAMVSPEAWEKIEKELKSAEAIRVRLETEISACTQEIEWINRCEDALPTVGRLSDETRNLETLSGLPDVSSDFVERARSARKAAEEAHAQLQRLQSHIARLEGELAGCQTSPALLAEADDLDRLHRELGAYLRHKDALSALEAEWTALDGVLRAGMRNMGLTGDLSSLEALRLNRAILLACEEAVDRMGEARKAQEKNLEKQLDLNTQVDTLEKQLSTLPDADLTDLREALATAAGATEANLTLASCESDVKRLAHEVRDRHLRLSGAPDDFDATGSLRVPSRATIRRAGEEMDGIIREIENEEAKVLEGKRRIESLRAEIARLERRGELPSRQALRKAREHRDRGWGLVLREWKGEGNGEPFVPGMPLEEAFPKAIAEADAIADQLREQAEAVAQVEEKHFQIAQAGQQSREAEQRASKLRERLGECRAWWEAEWRPCAMEPRTPAEMEEWREDWMELKSLLAQWRSAEETLRQKRSQVQEAKIQLARVISDSADKDFALLFDKAKRQVQQGEQLSGRRMEVLRQIRALKTQLKPLERKSERLGEEVAGAGKSWEAQCEAVGLPIGTSPKLGLALLRERMDLLASFDVWKTLSVQLREIKEAVRQYEQSVHERASAFGIEGSTAEVREVGLWKRLSEAREAQTCHDQLTRQIKEARNTLEECRASLINATQSLEEVLHQARLETVESLEPLLAGLELRDGVQARAAVLRDTLSGLARGRSVEEFVARVRAEDIEGLPHRKERLQSRRQEKVAEHQAVCDALSGLRAQRQAMEAAGDAAAAYRQQAESCAAKLRQDAARFIRLRLAAHFLQSQIEQFRKESQGPLLEKSGEIFRRITLGAFTGLGAEFNADDTPLLVGLRPDRSTVPVAGMSDGTRDQLYLALRLAALDRYLEQHEPMPLILDDLLITFDDDRATAILAQLRALSRRTQIFLFSHHEHLVELCRKTLTESAFHLHRLDGGTGKIPLEPVQPPMR